MTEYVAERYEPGKSQERLEIDAISLAVAVRELQAEGNEIEFLGCTYMPHDEATLSRFRSSSAALVEAAHARAAVSLARVVEALSLPVSSNADPEDRTEQEGSK